MLNRIVLFIYDNFITNELLEYNNIKNLGSITHFITLKFKIIEIKRMECMYNIYRQLLVMQKDIFLC